MKEVEIMIKNYDAVVIGAGNGGLVASARLAKEGKKRFLSSVTIYPAVSQRAL